MVCYVRTCLFVISCVSGRMCVLDGRGCLCTSINEEHLKSPAGGVCFFDPEAQSSIVLRCWNKGDYKGIDLATLNRFSFKDLPQAPSVCDHHTHSQTHTYTHTYKAH